MTHKLGEVYRKSDKAWNDSVATDLLSGTMECPVSDKVSFAFDPSSLVCSTTQFGLILDRTNFYDNHDAQKFDIGHVLVDSKGEISVQNVQVLADDMMHASYIRYGNSKLGDEVLCDDVLNLPADRPLFGVISMDSPAKYGCYYDRACLEKSKPLDWEA